MRYLALACDYDGTLAHDGRVDEATRAALERLRQSGRKLILVSGRELEDLLRIFPAVPLFDRVVVENGAVLYHPETRAERVLGPRPPEKFITTLHERGVQPLSVGRVIVATREPHQTTVLSTIQELGLELQVIFNKGAVMVLPAGVNKATGLAAALTELELSPHNVVGVGDAENDHSFLAMSECAAAVANALPMLKKNADLVTQKDHGAGVVELIDKLLANDLREVEGRLGRHSLLLGGREDGAVVRLRPWHVNVLIAGPSGSGKSTTATALIERLVDGQYQFCIIDPEGDYETFEGAVPLGNTHQAPIMEEILQVLKNPLMNVDINLVGLPLGDRPGLFMTLLARLQEMRGRTGRPHWMVVDEAHHLLPTAWQPASTTLPQDLDRLVLITVHPREVSAAILAGVDTVIAVGQAPAKTIAQFCEALGEPAPELGTATLEPGEVMCWLRHTAVAPFRVRVAPARSERRRHSRKYAEGSLPAERSFYFRGPRKHLNLRAQNLVLFVQTAEGVDDETWVFHLREGAYSRWFREVIKDDELAAEAREVEEAADLTPTESRARIRQAIEKHYTLPAASGARPPMS